jgi:hypothetical protein
VFILAFGSVLVFILALVVPWCNLALVPPWCYLALALPWCWFRPALVLIVPCLGAFFSFFYCLGADCALPRCFFGSVLVLFGFGATLVLSGFVAALVLVPPCLGAKFTLPWCWFRPALVLS